MICKTKKNKTNFRKTKKNKNNFKKTKKMYKKYLSGGLYPYTNGPPKSPQLNKVKSSLRNQTWKKNMPNLESNHQDLLDDELISLESLEDNRSVPYLFPPPAHLLNRSSRSSVEDSPMPVPATLQGPLPTTFQGPATLQGPATSTIVRTITSAKNKFIKRINQIWFGTKEIEPWRRYLFESNQAICVNHGYQYKLWTEKDRNKKNFPRTYEFQQKCLEYGPSRWAQVADLARLEIIYQEGGVYVDATIEISVKFLTELNKLFLINTLEFIGCNEDPCEFDCIGNANRKYLTNSFFAARKNSNILHRLLYTWGILENIDYDNPWINRTTGPYFLRTAITDEDIKQNKVFLFKTEQIFPYNINPTSYRPVNRNVCLYSIMEDEEGNEIEEGTNPKVEDKFIKVKPGQYLIKNCLKGEQKKYPEMLAIKQDGLGGTWSPK
jgi:hypothetical protein